MRAQCRRHVIVYSVAVAAWAVAFAIASVSPDPTSPWRLVFFLALQVAGLTTALAVLPWMLAGFIRERVMLYVAGLLHGQDGDGDGGGEADERPPLRMVR